MERKKVLQRPGETIYKGHQSYDLMLNLQQGILYSIGGLHEALPKNCDKVKVDFPRSGSSTTPPHPSSDFSWKDYAPITFKNLRDIFEIDPSEYMLSLCGKHCKSGLRHELCGRAQCCHVSCRRPGAAGAQDAREVRQRLLPVARRPLHHQDHAQGGDGDPAADAAGLPGPHPEVPKQPADAVLRHPPHLPLQGAEGESHRSIATLGAYYYWGIILCSAVPDLTISDGQHHLRVTRFD
eukprot:scaffold89274_cov46-Prasinocladus_malaysianus.AAC.1